MTIVYSQSFDDGLIKNLVASTGSLGTIVSSPVYATGYACRLQTPSSRTNAYFSVGSAEGHGLQRVVWTTLPIWLNATPAGDFLIVDMNGRDSGGGAQTRVVQLGFNGLAGLGLLQRYPVNNDWFIPYPFALGQWYVIQIGVDLNGSFIEVKINGVTVFRQTVDWIGTSPLLPLASISGQQIGLKYATIADAVVDNFFVATTPDETPFPTNRILEISTTDGGAVSPPPGAYIYSDQTVVSVTAMANMNYVLDHWLEDGTTSIPGAPNPVSILMDADHTLQAVFVYSPQNHYLSINTNPINGVGFNLVTGGQPVSYVTPYGPTLLVDGTYTITFPTSYTDPGTGKVYQFDHLSIVDAIGSRASVNPQENISLIGIDATVEATYTEQVGPGQLTVSVTPPSATVLPNEQASFVASISGGYPPYTVEWLDKASGDLLGTDTTFSFVSPQEGNYIVICRVTDSMGNKVEIELPITVTTTPPTPAFTHTRLWTFAHGLARGATPKWNFPLIELYDQAMARLNTGRRQI